MASTYLSRTTGTPTSADIGTMSFWMKRSAIDLNNHYIISNYTDGSNYGYIRFKSGDQLQAYGTQSNDEKRTNRVFRDTSAWYHIVLRVDTTQSTASDRVRLYVNGVQETSFSTNTNVAQNTDYDLFKSGGSMRIGSIQSGTMTYFDGCLSHFHYCDGQSYAPTVFGSTDSTTGEWKINTSPTITMGNNGFTILKDGNTITDQSSNSNDFTLGGGTLTKSEDCPSNVFATLNPLYHYLDGATLSNGNTGFNCGSSQNGRGMATIRPSTGKYYSEYKITNSSRFQIGIMNGSETNSSQGGSNANSVIVGYSGSCFFNNSSFTSYCGSFSNNDIVMIAIDCDNKLAWLGKNGTWFQSATATEIQNGTATNSLTTFISSQTPMSDTVGIFVEDNSGSGSTDGLFNFGNGNFGTTAVATNSGNGYAGAEGKSIFNYQPPTGYSALSTKGLNL